MGRGRHRDRARASGSKPAVTAGGEHVGKRRRSSGAQVEPDVIRPVGVDPVQDRLRHLVARGQLIGEPLAGGIEQLGALAPERLGEQGAVVL